MKKSPSGPLARPLQHYPAPLTVCPGKFGLRLFLVMVGSCNDIFSNTIPHNQIPRRLQTSNAHLRLYPNSSSLRLLGILIKAIPFDGSSSLVFSSSPPSTNSFIYPSPHSSPTATFYSAASPALSPSFPTLQAYFSGHGIFPQYLSCSYALAQLLHALFRCIDLCQYLLLEHGLGAISLSQILTGPRLWDAQSCQHIPPWPRLSARLESYLNF